MVVWGSSKDQTDPALLIKCERLEKGSVQGSLRQFNAWAKIAQLIEDLPII